MIHWESKAPTESPAQDNDFIKKCSAVFPNANLPQNDMIRDDVNHLLKD